MSDILVNLEDAEIIQEASAPMGNCWNLNHMFFLNYNTLNVL